MNGVINHKHHYSFECVLSLLRVTTTSLLKIDWRHDLEIRGMNNNGNDDKDCVVNNLQASFSIHKCQLNGCKTYLVGCIMFAWEV
jgi:hypothetical protein